MKTKFSTLILLLIFALIIIADISGYILLENASFVDALYMTVISITTVGYGEAFKLSEEGRMFTLFVIISGLGFFLYFAGKLVENTIEGQIRKVLGRRRLKNLLKLKNNIIIAGFGRMGEMVADGLSMEKKKFIIIEKDKDRVAEGEDKGYNILLADATSEDILKAAGAKNADTLLSLIPSDAENIFTVISVKEINPNIKIISRAMDSRNEKKLLKVGADMVISPYLLTSKRIINTITKPSVVEFFDIMRYSNELPLSVEEITVTNESEFSDKLIKNSKFREKYNAIIVGVKRDDQMHYNPSPDYKIKIGDILIIIGETGKLL